MAPVAASLRDVSPGNHGNVNLDCQPATSWSVFIFFVSNYLAHGATVKMYPGSSAIDVVVATVLALFLPSSGITRALFAILRYSRFKRGRNPLERAALAGALRMVVRNREWKAQAGDLIRPILLGPGKIRIGYGESLPTSGPSGTVEKDEAEAPGDDNPLLAPEPSVEITDTPTDAPDGSDRGRLENAPITNRIAVRDDDAGPGFFANIFSVTASFRSHASKNFQNFHGKALLPPGYSWSRVDPEAKISWAEPGQDCPEDMTGSAPGISSTYNWVQSLIALFQVGSAAATLYRARGDQIDRYGYAAFGLTVIPYLVMSIVNLVAQITTADYPTVFMVGSPELDEARARGGVFDGVVGRLEPKNVVGGVTDAKRPVYRTKALEGGDPATVHVMEKVSGGSAYPPVIRLAARNGAREYREISIREHTPYRVHDETWTTFNLWAFQFFVLPIALSCISLVVVGALTRFEEGQSTRAQRGWVMSWLVVGIAGGWLADLLGVVFIPDRDKKTGKIDWPAYLLFMVPTLLLFFGPLCAPAIGGFAVVGDMLREYGVCESR